MSYKYNSKSDSNPGSATFPGKHHGKITLPLWDRFWIPVRWVE